MNRPTFADFFAGIGLARMGLEAAGWKAAFCNDIDPKKFDMYKTNFGKRGYRLADIWDLTASQIPDVDLWWASFPCTDVSLAGYRRGLAGSQSGALMAMLTLLREKDVEHPPLVVLENVSGFISSHRGEDFDEAIRQLNGMGYACDAFVLDAIHFVPQSRARLFIIGVYDQPPTDDVCGALAMRDHHLKIKQLTRFMTERRDLEWVILNVPPPPHTSARLSDFLQRVAPESKRWWSEERVQYLLNQMFDRHRAVIEALKNRRSVSYGTVYRRMRNNKSMAELRADDIAGCLRTPRGGSSRQILLAAGRGTVHARFLTPRECARLMGAPSYRIRVTDNQAYFGFGDAVCVPAVTWIAENILNPLIAQTIEDVPQYASATS